MALEKSQDDQKEIHNVRSNRGGIVGTVATGIFRISRDGWIHSPFAGAGRHFACLSSRCGTLSKRLTAPRPKARLGEGRRRRARAARLDACRFGGGPDALSLRGAGLLSNSSTATLRQPIRL